MKFSVGGIVRVKLGIKGVGMVMFTTGRSGIMQLGTVGTEAVDVDAGTVLFDRVTSVGATDDRSIGGRAGSLHEYPVGHG